MGGACAAIRALWGRPFWSTQRRASCFACSKNGVAPTRGVFLLPGATRLVARSGGSPPLDVAVDNAPTSASKTVLLLLWDRQVDSGRDVVTVRAVHTLAPGVYGRAVPIDMSFDIEPGGTVFDQLAYRGDDQPDDFFPHIVRDDNEGTGTGNAQ